MTAVTVCISCGKGLQFKDCSNSNNPLAFKATVEMTLRSTVCTFFKETLG